MRGLSFLALLLALLPLHSSLTYAPLHVSAGQWWRVITYPFVHVSWYHALLDGTACLLLWRSLRQHRLAYVILPGAGSLLAAQWFWPSINQTGLCGLSGIAHGLMAISSLEMIRRRDRLGWLCFAMVAGKALLEAITGRVFFESFHFGQLGTPVAVCHLGGVIGGIIAAATPALTTTWLPRAIVGAINRPLAVVRSRRAPACVTRQLRVPVGPPEAELDLWVLDPSEPARGTIVVLHGIHGHKGTMRRTGELLAQAGYRAVLVDLRGHGQSSGRWLTFGVQEAHDLEQVLNALERAGLAAGPVGAFGTSYGAACALMWAGRDSRVEAVVSVAAFSTMTEEVPCFMRGWNRIPRWLVSDTQIQTAITQAGKLASFDPVAASPLAAISRTGAPVLLLHGSRDVKVPVEQAIRLQAAAGTRAELVVVPEAGHDSFFRDHDHLIGRATIAWFNRWLTKHSAVVSSPPRSKNMTWQLWLVTGLGIAAAVGLALWPPIRQDLRYHDFMDQRMLLGRQHVSRDSSVQTPCDDTGHGRNYKKGVVLVGRRTVWQELKGPCV